MARLGIEEYRISCVYDDCTCEICRQYDGKIYRVGEGPKPLFHPGCRCRIGNVIPESIASTHKKSARDAKGNSILIPYNMTFSEWEQRYRR